MMFLFAKMNHLLLLIAACVGLYICPVHMDLWQQKRARMLGTTLYMWPSNQ